MGQKVNPHGLRVGINKDWDSRWFAYKTTKESRFSDLLVEDYKLREFFKNKLKKAGIAKIEIERKSGKVDIIIHTAKPGMIIGNKGQEIEKLKVESQKLTKSAVNINIKEIKNPNKEAQLVAESIAQNLENRMAFRRAMKQAISSNMKSGSLGIKVSVGGRLAGADIARTEYYSEGTIPLQTLRANIDYGFAEADTTYGKLGVKVWVYKGEILPSKQRKNK